jgi:hypothetical protein
MKGQHEMAGKATEQELSELHGEFAKFLKKRLESDDVTAADLGQIRQFLKDNRVEATIEDNPDMGELAKLSLPKFDDSKPGDDFDDTEGSYH